MSKPLTSTPEPQLEAAQVFSSVRWLAVGQVATQAARFVVSLVLARLLAPSEFGLMTMAAVFTTVAALFSTLGAGPVIVQRRELSEALLRSLATLGLAMGFLMTFALAAGASTFAAFYGEPRVTWILIALGCQFAVTSFALVPEGLLQRELRFSRLIAIDIVQVIVGPGTSIILAFNGLGAWALVIGNLAGAAVRTALLVWSSPWRLRLGFQREAIHGVVGFSAGVMGVNLISYLSRYIDRVLIGRVLGATSLGYYDYAFRLYMYPLDVITSVLIRVMFPTFAKLQADPAQLGRAFLRANGAIAFVTFPMMIGLAVVADPFVRVVLGEQWSPIIPLIQILAPLGMLSALGGTPGQLFLARGKAALRFWWNVAYTSVIAAAVVFGLPRGIQGVATAYAAVMVPIVLVAFWLALRLVDLGLGALWATLRRTTAITAVMGGAVLLLRSILTGLGVVPPAVLAACVTCGAVAYVLAARFYPPQALADLHQLLPGAMRRHPLMVWLFSPAARAAATP